MGMSKNKKMEEKEGKRVFSAISVRDAKSTVSNRFNLWHFRCKNVIGSVEFFLYSRKFSYGRAPRFNQLFPISSPLSPRLHFFFFSRFSLFLRFFPFFLFFFFIPWLRNSWTHQSRRNSTAEVTFDNESY